MPWARGSATSRPRACSTDSPAGRRKARRAPPSSPTAWPAAPAASSSRRSAFARRVARCSITSTSCRASGRGGAWDCRDVTRVLIAGVSTGGFAESAVRAGYEVVAVDGFGDLDLRARAAVVRLARGAGGFSARAAVAAARRLRRDAVCYVASFENHPGAVAALARRGALWGNPPAGLARVRDPMEGPPALVARGLTAPA